MPGGGVSHQSLLIGDFSESEPSALAAELEQRFGRSNVRRAPGAVDALGAIGAGWYADVALVWQRTPGEFSAADADRLLGALPLARWLVCLGPWCISAGRAGSAWPPAVRVRFRETLVRLRRELGVLEGRVQPLPLTAGRDEVALWLHGPSDGAASPLNGFAVGIFSPDPAVRLWLGELLSASGCTLVDFDPQAPPQTAVDAAIIDVDPIDERALQAVGSASAAVPVIAVSSWSHAEDERRLRAAGATAVLSKHAGSGPLLEALVRTSGRGATRRLCHK
ncbi:MAG: response regulator [Planctomycetes bacterium]|nr:response regulator [Planctomycetota bacterium]